MLKNTTQQSRDWRVKRNHAGDVLLGFKDDSGIRFKADGSDFKQFLEDIGLYCFKKK
jgi:hypothetical protein